MHYALAIALCTGLILGSTGLSGPLYTMAQSVSKAPPPPPAIEDLGNQRYRIGTIEIDKAQQRFTVPGVLLRHQPPLEFLAVAHRGFKAYESLLELSTSAYEFNVACLLIGLDPAKGKAPRYHFDPELAQGDAVELWVSWETDGQVTQVEAADLIQLGDQTLSRGEWIYTGSMFLPDGRFRAQIDGTVIGFVHAPSSLIEHRSGFGLGQFGSVRPNEALLPPVGMQVKLVVERRTQERR